MSGGSDEYTYFAGLLIPLMVQRHQGRLASLIDIAAIAFYKNDRELFDKCLQHEVADPFVRPITLLFSNNSLPARFRDLDKMKQWLGSVDPKQIETVWDEIWPVSDEMGKLYQEGLDEEEAFMKALLGGIPSYDR